ncbi:MAG: hypothetical protein LLG06_09760 [Desulfobacteraceae bacterium]|nr:hypothetical protein [Desulfobacteraceae bacterium]
MTELEYIRRCSQYLDILVRNNPDYAAWLLEGHNINRRYPLTGLYSDLQAQAEKASSFNELLRLFRRFKQMHFLRIGARDLLGHADLAETTGQLSDLASVSLQIGLEILSSRPEWWIYGEEFNSWQRLREKIAISILGLGKLGGNELNYVSDIDLLFLYLERDEEEPEHFIMLVSRIAHWLSRLLSDRFEGDRVFQIDFRLRPQGKDGILVPSMGAAVDHYLIRGVTWERQMLLKCRPVAGDRSTGTAFIHEVRPFVYRRFLDFQALGELRDMRNRILTEAVRFRPATPQFDVKLGVGGIREIEFLVQSMQLIYGGRHPELDEPNTLKCIEKLTRLGFLPAGTAAELKESYTFLRRVEHCIQLDQNRQTQRLPQSEDARNRMVLAMGFPDDEAAFLKTLEEHCARVHANFSSLFQERPEEEAEDTGSAGSGAADLESFPAGPLERLRETLKAYSGSVSGEVLLQVGKFSEISDRATKEKVLVRIDSYFARVARRPGLSKLFQSVKPWHGPLCRCLASSELFSALLTHNPALVECLALGGGGFVPSADWESASMALLGSAGDYGEQLEWIRRLKNERVLQLAMADLGNAVGFEQLEKEHTSLALFVIRNTLEAVRQNLGLPADLPLSVLGMGKLGSAEMSFLSDLDLVFVYAPKAGEPEDQIPGPVIRLIQRFMNMLNTPLQEGPGYPVDARLRPTGTYGPLVVTRKSWLEYYHTQADIWEIQALLRVRHIAGDPVLGRWIENRSEEICYARRDPAPVWARICHLRDRMEKERAMESGGEIDLKLGMGGLADIEFLVQGKLLTNARDNPSHRFRSVRKAVGSFLGKLPDAAGSAGEIEASFKVLRALEDRLRLYGNSTSAKLDHDRFESMISLGLWPPLLEGNSVETWEDVLRIRREVRAMFRSLCPELKASNQL